MHAPLIAALLLSTSTVPAPTEGKLLTLEQAAGMDRGVSFSGRAPAWRFTDDGQHIVSGRGEEAVWISLATLEEVAAPASEPAAPEADDEARPEPSEADFAALEGVDEKLAKRLASARGQESEDGNARLIQDDGALWFWRAGVGARKLAQGGDAELELVELAPDGSAVAFVEANDLVIVDTATGERRDVTTDGSPELLNGKLDWVYQEEVYGRGDFKGFWWSPDSKRIAFLRLDESAVHEFTLVDNVEEGHFRSRPEVVNYPKSGDPNPTTQLGLAYAASGAVRWIDLAKYESEEPLVVRVEWTPEGDRLLYMVQDRIQTRCDLIAADPETGETSTWIEERSVSWTDRPRSPHWLDDGSFLWLSDRSGKRHVYHYRRGGELVGAVTQGDFAVSSGRRGGGLDVDEERGLMWYGSTQDGAVNANTYRVALDGSGAKRLTQGEGQHSIRWNDDRTYFLDTRSSLAQPSSVRLCDAEGNVLKELGAAEVPALDEYLTSSWELHEVSARDGFALDVAVLKPVPFDLELPHPVWISTYSGPNAPTVRNSWNSSAWFQFLAQQGVIVLQCNVRSASGKGHDTTATCYKQLGVQELRDLEDAIAWLTKEPWADAARVGITGHSYGGFMTAFALTHSKAFALGVAGSGVYDWGMYDTIYTERYMSTPQLNPDGYKKSSVLAAAKDLHGHLVITHGTIDDNVHLQNAMQLVFALQKADLQNAGSDFELMVYPNNRHGIRDRAQRFHRQRLEWKAIQEHLKPRGVLDTR